MKSQRTTESIRRRRIGDAGIFVIAEKGVRGLTHRSVDVQSGLPLGSTSYYARTRRKLLTLVVDRLADHTEDDLSDLKIPAVLTPDDATQVVESFLGLLSKREQTQAARFALLFELRHDEELRRDLTIQAPVRIPLLQSAEELLRALGAPFPTDTAPDLVALVDALLMYDTARAASLDAPAILRAYFKGLLRLET